MESLSESVLNTVNSDDVSETLKEIQRILVYWYMVIPSLTVTY